MRNRSEGGMSEMIRRWVASAMPARRRTADETTAVNNAQRAVGESASAGQSNDAMTWYLNEAMKFERSKMHALEEKARVADRRSFLSSGIALVAVFGIGALGILKRPNPPAVLRVDNETGKVDVLPTTADGKVSFSKKTDRHDLHTYVELRESYDWETIDDTHKAVMLMSEDKEATIYDNFMRGGTGPLKLLKDQARVLAKVGSITFVGSTAQVFFSRQLVPLNQAVHRPDPTFWIATVGFTRVDIPEKQDEQDIDPDGFRCTSYQVSRDWTRATSDAVPASPSSRGGT